MKTVLAPIDFSAVSENVIYRAIGLAQVIGARVVLLHVVEPAPLVATNFGMIPASDPLAAVESEAAMRQLRDWQRRLQTEGLTVHALHQIGRPGERILEQADRLDASYIVMGLRGHGAFYDLMVGGTATFVLHRATQPVILLPPALKPQPKPKRRSAETSASLVN